MRNYIDKNKLNYQLPDANAKTSSIDEAWTGNNEQWWDWYLSLADNSQESVNEEELIIQPEYIPDKIPSLEELKKELAEPCP